MFNVIASIRKDKADKRGEVPIYIFVYEGERLIAKKSIGQRISPHLWDADARRAKGPLATLINAMIAKHTHEQSEAVIAARLKGESVKAALQSSKRRDAAFESFAARVIDGRNTSEATKRNYRIYLSKFIAFRPGATVRDISPAMLRLYHSRLNEEGASHNYIASNMKFIAIVMNAALHEGIISESPFREYKRPRYKNNDRTYLTEEELQKIEDSIADMPPGLAHVAEYFLFMARTGLRFSDAARFRPEEHIREGRIELKAQKTGKLTALFVNDTISRRLDYIAGNRLKITQVEFNRRLKIIAAMCGIKKKISSHVARHSFGAALVDLEVPIEVARELLSHGSTAMTRIYYHMKNRNLDEAMKRFDKKKPG